MSIRKNGKVIAGSFGTRPQSQPLLSFIWSDHLLNDISWLRADTFSWQSGVVYEGAYNKLIEEYTEGTDETENGVIYKHTSSGFKICGVDQESNIVDAYNIYGVAWYYILDVDNKRFKLPRTKYGMTGLRDSAGKFVEESLPNITGNFSIDPFATNKIAAYYLDGAFTKSVVTGTFAAYSSTEGSDTTDRVQFSASNSSSVYQDNAHVQSRATQMYLYFFMGDSEYSESFSSTDISIQKALENKADLDLNNTNVFSTSEGVVSLKTSTPEKAGAKEVVSADYVNNKLTSIVTNCITEIPQDIKFELNDGVLTLKAGSKIWYPDGFEDDQTTLNFSTYIIPADTVVSQIGTNSNALICYIINSNTCYTLTGTNSFSGDAAPTSPTNTTTWYDTSANIIKVYNGTDWVSTCSFLLGIFDNENGKVTKLKRVFNGFGYIGLTAYALPGLKLNFVSGRNADGSYKTQEVTTKTVLTRTYDPSASTVKREFCIDTTGNFISAVIGEEYQDADGKIYHEYNGVKKQIIPLMNYYIDTAIRDVKFYNVAAFTNIDGTNLSVGGRSRFSALGLPSDRYINLTFGASGTTYTAPANGYASLCIRQQASGALYVQLRNKTTGIREQTPNLTGTGYYGMTIAVRKGDVFEVYYSPGFDLGAGFVRFYYAEGEV